MKEFENKNKEVFLFNSDGYSNYDNNQSSIFKCQYSKNKVNI